MVLKQASLEVPGGEGGETCTVHGQKMEERKTVDRKEKKKSPGKRGHARPLACLESHHLLPTCMVHGGLGLPKVDRRCYRCALCPLAAPPALAPAFQDGVGRGGRGLIACRSQSSSSPFCLCSAAAAD